MHHKRAVYVPVHVTWLPDDLEIMAIALVIPKNLRVLEVGYTVPVRAVDSIRFVADLFHINFSFRVGGVKKPRGYGTGIHTRYAGGEFKCAIAEFLRADDLRATGKNLAATLSLCKSQYQLRSDNHVIGIKGAHVSIRVANWRRSTAVGLPIVPGEGEGTRANRPGRRATGRTGARGAAT